MKGDRVPVLDSLDRREQIPELMDDPGIDPAEHRAALAALARINRLSFSADILWPPMGKLARRFPNEMIRVLDIATGGGDLPVRLWQKARRAGLANLAFHGCDISPTALQNATENAKRVGAEITFFQHDILNDPPAGRYDVLMCSLFLHHLSADEAVIVLRRMKEWAARLVLVNDLERSRLGFMLAWLGCHLLTRSRVVRFDGPASVRSAFTPREALRLAERAGLSGTTVGRRWPCRFLLSWSRR
ncbi:MAG TPA: methyltransferase domain-containing protein [Gemmataceae bacterium]|nr:methyltransferase domain-containing protein [Gemmataceae bacterium]